MFKKSKDNDLVKIANGGTRLSLSRLFYPVVLPVVAVFVAIIIVVILNIINKPSIDDGYFVTDDTKTSISLFSSDNDATDGSHIRTHFVYTYDDNGYVSGLKTYFEYTDEEAAKTALETLKNQPEFKGAVVENKYIVVTAEENQYKGLTASDIKQQTDALKRFQENQKPITESVDGSNEHSVEEDSEGSDSE